MSKQPVIILGAGATKACGGPLTAEILPQAIELRAELDREDFIQRLEQFLVDTFHLPEAVNRRKDRHYPALPLLISLLDIAIDRKHSLGKSRNDDGAVWDTDQLEEVRESLEYAVFAVLERQLRPIRRNECLKLIQSVFTRRTWEPHIVSLNYDLISDNSLMTLSERRPVNRDLKGERRGCFPDYGCDVATELYRRSPHKFGLLLKLHGSLNWLFCPGCSRLDIGISSSGRRMVKMLDALWREDPQEQLDLEQRYTCQGSPCPECEASVRPVMITPTHMKDYRNPHIAQVWYRAERVLRQSDRAIIVGYSLPDDDVDVTYLLKRGLGHLPPERITVVEYDRRKRPRRATQHPVGQRYVTLFGEKIDWHPEGLATYVESVRQRGHGNPG